MVAVFKVGVCNLENSQIQDYGKLCLNRQSHSDRCLDGVSSRRKSILAA
jgi:hypothetical protein